MSQPKYKLNLKRSKEDGRDWNAENIYAAGPLHEKFSMKDIKVSIVIRIDYEIGPRRSGSHGNPYLLLRANRR